jgi:membrane-bound metal-dependent hydrolase YbcI (DUF457 family)
VPLAIGSWAPDLMTKWFVYGISIGGLHLKASHPAQFHRGWPGVGFTHSLLFGAVLAFLIWRIFGSKVWAISFLIGQWAHALTDTGDTVGTMLFFPWTIHIHLNAWAYAGQTGRLRDAAAYFSGLGAVWDAVWIVYGLFSWRVLTRSYFEQHIYPADKLWTVANRHVPTSALLVAYRAAFFYGTSRWIAWTLWAHAYHHYPYDLSWGGPHWASAAHSPPLSWAQLAGVCGIVATGLAIASMEWGRRKRARNEREVGFPCECGCREVVTMTKAQYQAIGGAWVEGHKPDRLAGAASNEHTAVDSPQGQAQPPGSLSGPGP